MRMTRADCNGCRRCAIRIPCFEEQVSFQPLMPRRYLGKQRVVMSSPPFGLLDQSPNIPNFDFLPYAFHHIPEHRPLYPSSHLCNQTLTASSRTSPINLIAHSVSVKIKPLVTRTNYVPDQYGIDVVPEERLDLQDGHACFYELACCTVKTLLIELCVEEDVRQGVGAVAFAGFEGWHGECYGWQRGFKDHVWKDSWKMRDRVQRAADNV